MVAVNRYYLTANRIINDVAVDVGLDPVADAVASSEKQFVQLTRQLNIAIEEIAEVHTWQQFKRQYSITTDIALNPDSIYPLPSDFHAMIDQTHWNQSTSMPLAGPVSSQQWQYLLGTNLSTTLIYAAFREQEGLLELLPTDIADGLVIAFEYSSRNWIRNAADDAYLQTVALADDLVLLAPSLIRGYLKAKYLGSKGFQTMDANEAVSLFLNTAGGKDAGAPTLNVGMRAGRFPYLNPYRNVRDTGYGS